MAIKFKPSTLCVKPKVHIEPSIGEVLTKKKRVIQRVRALEPTPEQLNGSEVWRTGHVLFVLKIGQPALWKRIANGTFPKPSGHNPRPYWAAEVIRSHTAKPAYDFEVVNAGVRSKAAERWNKRESRLKETPAPEAFEKWLAEWLSPEALAHREEVLRRRVSLTINRMRAGVTAKANRHATSERLRVKRER
jgi:hypothetical protein